MELTPSQNQIMGLVRQIVPVIGSIVTMLGWAPPAIVDSWVANILAAAGPIIVLVGLALSLKANTKSSIVQAAAGMDETKVERHGAGVVVTISDPSLARDAVVAQQQAKGI